MSKQKQNIVHINGKQFTIAQTASSKRLLKVAKVFGAKTLTEAHTMFIGVSNDEAQKIFDALLLNIITDDERLTILLGALIIEPLSPDDIEKFDDVFQLGEMLTNFFTNYTPGSKNLQSVTQE